MKNKALRGALIAASLALAPLAAHADHRHDHHDPYGDRHWDGHHDWRGGIVIRDHHPHWHSGRWVHEWHGGVLGWWWIVDGMWHPYAAPVYPYPAPYAPPVIIEREAPPVVIIPQPAVPQSGPYWYYCDSARGYYPYVTRCPEGWRPVSPTPPQ